MTDTQYYRLKGEQLCPEPLHYTDCGLDNVYLLNGFDDSDEGLIIKDMRGLHKAIGMNIVCQRKAPSGRELRFLRDEMDMTQVELGTLLGISSQSVARWEKGQTEQIGAAVFSLRVLYLMSVLPEKEVATFLAELKVQLEALGQSDETTDKVEFSYENHQWRDAA